VGGSSGAPHNGRPLDSKLDPYKPSLEQRFQEGCETAAVLWREIQAQGFEGSASLVPKLITPLWRMSAIPTIVQVKREPPYSLPDLVLCVLRRPAERTGEQQAVVARLRQVDQTIQTACDLSETFAAMVRDRQPQQLDPWLDQAESSTLPEFRPFVRGLRRDAVAVRNALELPYSNGITEGQIHRLKLVKRAM